MILNVFQEIFITMNSKFCMFKELEQLQNKGCQTDVCIVGGDGEKVFIHRAMLFADHVQPHSVWHQLDPGECDGKVLVIIPDASSSEFTEFCEETV